MNKKSRYFFLSMGTFLISSLTIFVMPLFPRNTHAQMSNMLAVVFWLFLISGIVFTVLLSRNIRSKNKKAEGFKVIFRFFQTKQMKIIDIVFIVSLLSEIIMAALNINIGWMQLLFIFFSIFTLELHCVFSILGQKIYRRKENVEKI